MHSQDGGFIMLTKSQKVAVSTRLWFPSFFFLYRVFSFSAFFFLYSRSALRVIDSDNDKRLGLSRNKRRKKSKGRKEEGGGKSGQSSQFPFSMSREFMAVKTFRKFQLPSWKSFHIFMKCFRPTDRSWLLLEK